MGSGKWKPNDWSTYTTSRSYSTKTTEEIYHSRKINKDLDPHGVNIRESRDSEDNPNSNAVIVSLDVTRSMSPVLDSMAREGLNNFITNLYDRKPILDPHLMIMAVGDAEMGDEAPLQVTQFEADIRIAEQLEKIWLEQRGGNNMYESYALPWYFASMHTNIDCLEKRNKKGYLFTIGDEAPTPYLRKEDIKRVTGDVIETDRIDGEDLLSMVSRKYEVFHLIIEQGNNYQRYPNKVLNEWFKLLGQKAIRLSDHKKMAEVIVSTIQVNEGLRKEDIINSWDGDTSLVVGRALSGLPDKFHVENKVVRL